jgi:hypothetical protein
LDLNSGAATPGRGEINHDEKRGCLSVRKLNGG